MNVCVICRRALRTDEAGHACRICQERGTGWLRALPGLYAAAEDHLAPARSGAGGGRVSGSKHAPLPVRLNVLDAVGPGGVVWVIAQWEDVVRDQLEFGSAPSRGGYLETLTGSCRLLADQAPWLYGSFNAVDELHGELRSWHARLSAVSDGADRERRITLACPCGAALTGVTLSTPGRRCDACGAQYGWTELRGLPLADRSAA
ncbi:hypothetical protein H3146_05910 [Streptomyces sp. OF3]|uniref:Uncharacterized protein n=1 Tax=Streptomyces alkaliterrae TaxID=2213162 RepID=A0A7W3WIB9_9ACTN|nr:hypothetical protein [Streptomyces alkaliterrae]MBB1252902.1 hypothetical protein [Streptomyces alkaliterrae]